VQGLFTVTRALAAPPAGDLDHPSRGRIEVSSDALFA
jgi:hypothetical protein